MKKKSSYKNSIVSDSQIAILERLSVLPQKNLH